MARDRLNWRWEGIPVFRPWPICGLAGTPYEQPYLVGRALKALPRMLARPAPKAGFHLTPPQKQRRLKPIKVDHLVETYVDGSTAQQVADAINIDRRRNLALPFGG